MSRLYIVTCLFNFYAEYIMRNAGLEETQAGIKIAGRNINNLSYADDTTLMAESEEELKIFFNFLKTKIFYICWQKLNITECVPFFFKVKKTNTFVFLATVL